MTKANGEATATITVPAAATAEVDLTWQAPQQTFVHHQPEIMIMRSGEGDILFKGAICASSEEWSKLKTITNKQFGYYPPRWRTVVIGRGPLTAPRPSPLSLCPTWILAGRSTL